MLQTEQKDIASTVAQAVEKHGKHADALIPILLEINQVYGHIPAEAYREVKRQMGAAGDGMFVPESRLYSLATFYRMLYTKPHGRHLVQFCESAPCHVQGGRELWQAIQSKLKLKAGETDSEGRFTLVTVSCLGTCGVGPVVVVDDDMYGNVTPEQLDDIFAKYE